MIGADAIADMSGNGNNESVLTPNSITPDTTPPYLVYYDLDLTAEVLSLTFSEVVIPSQTTPTEISLLSNAFEFDAQTDASNGQLLDENDPATYRGSLRAYTLSGTVGLSGPNTVPTHPPVLLVLLTDKDLNILKSLEFVATSIDNTYLLIQSTGAWDYYGNPLVEIRNSNGKQVRVHTPDRIPPELLRYSLDLDAGQISLTFTESMNVSSLRTTALSLQGTANASDSDIYTLTGGMSNSYNGPVVLVSLSTNDLNEIKRRPLIAFDDASTFISFTRSFITDQNRNPIVEVSGDNATLVQDGGFIPDTTRPQVLTFSLDLNTGRFHLTFNETIDSLTFAIEELTLSDNGTTIDTNLTLSVGTLLTNDSMVLSYELSVADQNEIKLIDLCIVAENGDDCYLTFTNESIQDRNQNSVVERPDGNAIQVDPYITDTTPPEIVFFAVNMSLGNFTLGFSETVDVSTFDPTGLTLSQSDTPFATLYNLTGGTRITAVNGLSIDFYLNFFDLEFVRLNGELYISQTTAYISARPTTLMDTSGVPLRSTAFYLVDQFTPDTLGPTVIEARVNLTSRNITLYFDESIRASTLRPEELTLLSSSDVLGPSYRLNAGRLFGIDSSFNGPVITFTLLPLDYLEILANTELAISLETTYIMYTADIVDDLVPNAATVIPPLRVTEYFPDEVAPELVNFLELDLQERYLVLEFSEAVNLSTADVTQFSLQNNPRRENIPRNVTFTGGALFYQEPDTYQKRRVRLNFNAEDYRQIVLDTFIARSNFSSFISIPSGGISDFNDNPLRGLTADVFLSALVFRDDLRPPELVNFDLDVDSGILTLEFDNVMNPDTLDATGVTIQNSALSTATRYTLTGGTTASDPGYTIAVNLTQDDLNEIKRNRDIATNVNTTYITITANLLSSYGGVNVEGVPPPGLNVRSIVDEEGLQVQFFTDDTTDPVLVSFDLDLTAEVLSLTFDETVRAPTFDFTEIVLQSEREFVANLTTQFRLTRRSTLGEQTNSSREDDKVITIELGFEDRNDIYRLTDLATDSLNTHISFSNLTVQDMNGNFVEPVPDSDAASVRVFTQDRTEPSLVRFDLDMNDEVLTLTFDETVNASSLFTPAISLQNTENGLDERVDLTLDSFPVLVNDYIIMIMLGPMDSNEIKRNQGLAQSDADTFISFTPDAVQDMNGNSVTDISMFAGTPVSNFTADITSPNLLAYHLDMDREVIHFTFDETVDVSTFVFTELVFLSSSNITHSMILGEVYPLTMPGMEVTGDTTEPTYQIAVPDIHQIKLIPDLASELNNTYIMFDMNLIRDMALPGLNLVSPVGMPFPAANFTPDTTRPMVLSFTVDMDMGIISLFFDEPVNTSSVEFSGFTLYSSSSPTPPQYMLMDGSTNSSNGRYLVVNITEDDLNEVKRLEGLFDMQSTSFLQLNRCTIRDMAGNCVDGTGPLPAMDFVEDRTRPVLLSFDLDMTLEILTLHFRETVDYMTLNVTFITLQQDFDANGLNDTHRLTGGMVSQMDDTTLMISLTSLDLNQLKTLKIAVNNVSVYLTIDQGAVLDQAGEPLRARMNGMTALPVSEYNPDTTSPELISFVLDLNGNGTLWLTFSETVNADTFNATQLTLQNSEMRNSDASTYFTLSSGSENFDHDLPMQRVSLSVDDLNELKHLFRLATNINDTYISILPGGIEDVFGNEVIERGPSRGLQATAVLPDLTPPDLVGYIFNLTSERLILTFTETVDASSLSIPSFSLLSTQSGGAGSRRFNLTDDSEIEGGNPVGLDSTEITITLGTDDLNAIKMLPELAVSPDSLYLVIGSDGIRDMSGINIAPQTPRAADEFIEDAVPPMLLRYSLDMNIGVLSLTFDETVNGSSLMTDEILISDAPSNDSEYRLMLSGPEFVTPNFTTVIDIPITDSDLNEIKRQRGLATNGSNTFLSFSEMLILDMNRNRIVSIDEFSADPVSIFVNDTTPPMLVNFELNLTSELLILMFSETVRVETININQITIQDVLVMSPDFYWMLRGGEILSNDSTTVVLRLRNDDLNEIKIRTRVATSSSNTYITVTDMLIQDMNENWNSPVLGSNPTPVSEFTEDQVEPELDSFDLDMDGSGLLTLYFAESVNVSSLDVTQLTLLMAPGNLDLMHTLGSMSYANSSNGPTVEIVLSLEDLNRIKQVETLAVVPSTTYISITSDLVMDMNRNSVVEIQPDNAMRVDRFTEDTTPPVLLNFTLDLTLEHLVISFSEIVSASTLERMRFRLQNQSDSSSSQGYVILEDALAPDVSFDSVITMPLITSELNTIKRMTELATSVDNTWLAVETRGIEDTHSLPFLLMTPCKQALFSKTGQTQRCLLLTSIWTAGCSLWCLTRL